MILWAIIWLMVAMGLAYTLAEGICRVRHRNDQESWMWTYIYVWLWMLGCVLWFTT